MIAVFALTNTSTLLHHQYHLLGWLQWKYIVTCYVNVVVLENTTGFVDMRVYNLYTVLTHTNLNELFMEYMSWAVFCTCDVGGLMNN